MDDWKSKLSGLLADNPDLPAGDDIAAQETDAPEKRTLPRLDIILDRKRAGKTATIIAGFDDEADIKEIAARLKQRLGAGGSARGGEILIQGDRRNDAARILADMGYKFRLI
ncbi:MAG: translation initiation factor [Muribaculaceae bacterium]|nr:translation initiation factor [Muribaculaceae bacterium]